MGELQDLDLITALYSTKQGDTEAARALFRMSVERMKQGGQLPESVLDHLSQASERIDQGESADKALGLVGDQSGRHRDRSLWLRDLKLATAVRIARENGDEGYEVFIRRIAEANHVSKSTVKKADTDYRKCCDLSK